ncbi:EKC/KEOPS complex subunit tprkb-like protein isoform X1 [Wolffia australiana]
MKEFNLGGCGCPGGRLSLALFVNVTNSKNSRIKASDLLRYLSEIQGKKDLLKAMQEGVLEPEAALINASLVPDVFPVLAAAQKALLANSNGQLTTRTLHSELVYNYSGSKHISESLKRCGISDSSTYILVARFNASVDEMKSLEKLMHGTEVDLEKLGRRADLGQIQKHYKISAPELAISSLSDAILCRIAARDAL